MGAHGISPFVQNSAQNYFLFRKTTCFWQSTWNIAICPKFSPKLFPVSKNHMFLAKHMEYRHLSEIQPKFISGFEKPHVSGKAHGISPFVQNSAQIYFRFRKTTCFWQSTWRYSMCFARNMWFFETGNKFGLNFGQMAIFHVLCQKHVVFRNRK